MSLKQVQKLKEQLTSIAPSSAGEDDDDGEPDPGIGLRQPARSAFTAAYSSSSSSDSEPEEEEEEEAEAPVEVPKKKKKKGLLAIPDPKAEPSASHSQKQSKRERQKKKLEQYELEEKQILDDLEQLDTTELDQVVAESSGGPLTGSFPIILQKANFCVDSEFRRVFGREANKLQNNKYQRNQPMHFRKLWLVKPTKPWVKPDVTQGALVMNHTPDGFLIELPKDNEKALAVAVEFVQVLKTHDLGALQDFVRRYPYHVNALLSLAEVCNQRGNHEEAFLLIKRALYTLESHFHIAFHPFPRLGMAPNVYLHRKSFSTLGRALLEYMHCLNGQGLFGTALEVGKFILLCEQGPALVDPIHVMLFLDYSAIRARRYTFFDEIHSLHFHWFLPNIAYNTALAYFNQLPKADDLLDELNELYAEDCAWDSPCKNAATALIRAIIMYPLIPPVLVEKAKIDINTSQELHGKKWADIFLNPIFRDFRTPANICPTATTAFVQNAVLWRSPVVITFLYRCCRKLDTWTESSVITEDIRKAKTGWITHTDSETYQPLWDSLSDILASECKEGVAERILPKSITDSMEEFEVMAQNFMAEQLLGHNQAFPELPFTTISLQTHPLFVFFHSIIPWAEIKQGAQPFQLIPSIQRQGRRLWAKIINAVPELIMKRIRPQNKEEQEQEQGQQEQEQQEQE